MYIHTDQSSSRPPKKAVECIWTEHIRVDSKYRRHLTSSRLTSDHGCKQDQSVVSEILAKVVPFSNKHVTSAERNHP